MTELWRALGITPVGALGVVVSSVVMYAVFAGVLHLWGDRLRGSGSTFTVAVAALIGSIAARATLGNSPTLAGGLIALATLLLMERVFAVLWRATRRSRAGATGGRLSGSRRHERSGG